MKSANVIQKEYTLSDLTSRQSLQFHKTLCRIGDLKRASIKTFACQKRILSKVTRCLACVTSGKILKN